jgi:hypothetical protein
VGKNSASRWIAILALAAMSPLGQGLAQDAHTLKERLSDKASDQQRVDNCHVPAERRGAAPRPDCLDEPRPAVPVAKAGPPAAPNAR